MKKVYLFAAACTIASAASSPAFSQEGHVAVTQIEQRQWKITWEDYTWVNPLNVIVDANNPLYLAYLTDTEGSITPIYYRKEVIFPDFGNYFTVNLEPLDIPDGEYVLTIPAGYVSLVPGNQPNETEYLLLKVGGVEEFPHNPIFTEVSEGDFNIYWENVTALAPGTTSGAYIENVETGKTYEMSFTDRDFYSEANIRIVNNYLKVTVMTDHPDLPDGDYRFYLPADYVKFNGSDSGNAAIDGMLFSFVAPWNEGPVVIDGPMEDGTITLEWTKATEVSYNEAYEGDGWGTTGVCVYDGADIKIDIPYPDNISFAGNVMILNLAGLDINSGQCQLVVPTDCLLVTVNGITDLSDGVVYRFGYTNPDMPEIPDTPDYPFFDGEALWNLRNGDTAGSEPLSVGWTGCMMSPVEDPDDAVSVYSNETGYFELTYGKEVNISDDGTRLLISLAGLPEGIYRVNVPEAFLYLIYGGETYVNVATALDGISVLNGDSGIETVFAPELYDSLFSISGLKVGSKDHLSPGIYIIGGKKVNLR